MKSKAHYWKGAEIFTGLRGKDLSLCLLANLWHFSHALTFAQTSENILGQ
jgi:hypothetical protein